MKKYALSRQCKLIEQRPSVQNNRIHVMDSPTHYDADKDVVYGCRESAFPGILPMNAPAQDKVGGLAMGPKGQQFRRRNLAVPWNKEHPRFGGEAEHVLERKPEPHVPF